MIMSYDKLRVRYKAKADQDDPPIRCSIRCRETEQMERENELLQYLNTLGVCNHVSELIGSRSATSRHVTHSREQLTLRKMKVRILITRIVMKFGTRKSKKKLTGTLVQLSICCPNVIFRWPSPTYVVAFQLTKNYLNMTSVSNLIQFPVGYHVSD
eukprot:sb/3473166/